MNKTDRFRRFGVHLAVLAMLCSGLTLATFSQTAEAAGTTITVTSTADPDGSETRDTCTLTLGGGAITRAAPDGACTLRRAIIQAERLPDAARPIHIVFDIPTNDGKYDAGLGIWEVQIDDSDHLFIEPDNVTLTGGGIIIDGDTQPGGRTTGPKIMINNNRDDSPLGGASLIISAPNNEIRNVGFHGGGELQIQSGDNTIENIWMGLNNAGTEMQTESTGAPGNLAGGGINMSNSASDDNIIQDNVIIGTKSRAISVTSGGSGNLIDGNWIGTNADGAVVGPLDCVANTTYFASKWYGGEGIRVFGSNNTVTNNLLAGLNTTRATNDTRPIALEIYGTSNLVQSNFVGIDTENDRVGVCGRGLLFGGSQSTAIQNFFFNTKPSVSDDAGTLFDSAVFSQSFSGGGNGASDFLEVHSNIIDGGDDPESNTYAYRHGDVNIPDVLRLFNPAKVTSVNGTTVTGTNGDEVPDDGIEGFCPGCKIYLYGDDEDDRIEAKVLLGTATADSNGDWTATMFRPLNAGEGIRTQSQALAPNVIGNHGAKVTTHLSDDLFPLPIVLPDAFCLGQLVTINMNQGATGTGTAARDVILGTPGADTINGLGGSDVICGEGGNDIIDGGTGDDAILAGAGNDTVNLGDGDDATETGDGDDTVNGGNGDDSIDAGAGNDTVNGDAGEDAIDGGEGDDTVNGGADDDILDGSAGADTLNGDDGDDVLRGGDGDDRLSGGEGDDAMGGGDGLDFIFGENGDDYMEGGEGNDRLRGGPGIDWLEGENGNDFLYGGIEGDTINGGNGNDTIGGFGGADLINGGPGNDLVFGGFGADTINGGTGDDDLRGLIGNDTIHGDEGDDTLYGDNGRDTLFGDVGNDTLNGGNSLDDLRGGAGDDVLNGGKADDTLSGGGGNNDTCTGNKGTDTADSTCEKTFGVP